MPPPGRLGVGCAAWPASPAAAPSPWPAHGGGFLLVTERTYQRFAVEELDQLAFELDRLLRDLRGEQPALDDLPAIQQRNRKLQRLNSALSMLRGFQQRARARAHGQAERRPARRAAAGEPLSSASPSSASPPMLDALRLWAPPLLGVLAAFAFDRASARRGLRPPGFGGIRCAVRPSWRCSPWC